MKLPSRLAGRNTQPSRQGGAALVVGLILLLVLTVLAISGMTTAALQLQMAGNEQYQERAFQFADAGIEQAIDAGAFADVLSLGTYDDLLADDPRPVRGTGQQTANCPEPADPAPAQECEFFVRYDQLTGGTHVPDGRGYSIDESSGFIAHHYVIDSYGTAERGAMAEHRGGVYIVGPPGGDF